MCIRDSFWSGGTTIKDERSFEKLVHLKLNVSSRWAPGSSGSPVLDQSGNVIGHVALIKTLKGGKEKAPMITIHSAIPARSVASLCAKEVGVEKVEMKKEG